MWGIFESASAPAADAGLRLSGSGLLDRLDERTIALLDRRHGSTRVPRRGWVIRRALLTADLVGLILAFAIAEALYDRSHTVGSRFSDFGEIWVFLASLPGWIVVAKLYGLYERDEERTDHTTVEDLVSVFHLLTVGVWLFYGISRLTTFAQPNISKLFVFWLIGIVVVPSARVVARSICRRHVSYLQNTLIVGAGDVGQLVARKLMQHHEYGINLVGFVDDDPKERREDLSSLAILGSSDDLPSIVKLLDVERVIFAFSNESDQGTLELVRSVDDANVQVDIVPRLFEVVTPTAEIHLVEGLPLLGLRLASPARSSLALKRAFDLALASLALALTSPLFLFIAFRVRRDSPGPIFFRQTRLGMNEREFTLFKFRTMREDTDSGAHEEFIKRSMNAGVAQEGNGLFKLDRGDVITRSGAWLRRSSLDELPQLLNVIRGDMSLVGPRPCLPYEVAFFESHHFERFRVPAGMTGLWQVMARAHASFREALDMDVTYARAWSLGLDLRLLLRTPLQLSRPRGTA